MPVQLDQAGLFEKELLDSIPCLNNLAMGLCRNRSRAEDLRQETMTRAWNARARFQPGSCFKAWICTIMRNQFRTECRSSWRQAPWDQLLAERVMTVADEQTPILEFHDAVRMDGLPALQRAALMTIGVDGLSYRQAAAAHLCPVGTMKSRVTRARRALKDALENGSRSTELAQTIPIAAMSPHRYPRCVPPSQAAAVP